MAKERYHVCLDSEVDGVNCSEVVTGAKDGLRVVTVRFRTFTGDEHNCGLDLVQAVTVAAMLLRAAADTFGDERCDVLADAVSQQFNFTDEGDDDDGASD